MPTFYIGPSEIDDGPQTVVHVLETATQHPNASSVVHQCLETRGGGFDGNGRERRSHAPSFRPKLDGLAYLSPYALPWTDQADDEDVCKLVDDIGSFLGQRSVFVLGIAVA